MTTEKLIGDCQFCSVVSKANGEDPIGTAITADIWLIMEIPLPWTKQKLFNNPLIEHIQNLCHELQNKNIRVIPMAIAPQNIIPILLDYPQTWVWINSQSFQLSTNFFYL